MVNLKKFIYEMFNYFSYFSTTPEPVHPSIILTPTPSSIQQLEECESMKERPGQTQFWFIETLIFLSVSSFLFRADNDNDDNKMKFSDTNGIVSSPPVLFLAKELFFSFYEGVGKKKKRKT